MNQKIDEVMEEFDKFVDVFPGNSGFGGSDPQEPEANWNEEPLEVRKWLTSKLQEVFEQGRKEGVQSAIEALPTYTHYKNNPTHIREEMWCCMDCYDLQRRTDTIFEAKSSLTKLL